MAQGTFQPLDDSGISNPPQVHDSGPRADHLVLVAGHAIRALIRDRGEPATAAEHRALMRDAALLAQVTWMALQKKD